MEENTQAVIAESAPAEQVVEEASEPIAEIPAEDVSSDASDPEEDHRPRGAEKRIKQLLAKQKQAQDEAEQAKEAAQYWKTRAESSNPPINVEVPQEPRIDDFETYEDFLVAKTKHEVLAAQKSQALEQERDRLEKSFADRIAKAATGNPGIYSVLNDASLPVSPAMGIAIKNAESGPEMLVYLGSHRDEALRIAQLDPLSAVKEMGKLELKLAQMAKPEPVRKVSLAPEPIKPLEATGTASIDLEKISMEEYMRTRNQGMKTGRIKRR